MSIVDSTPPVLTTHANITATTDVNAPKAVTYVAPTATDTIDPTHRLSPVRQPQVRTSRSSPPAATVTCTATDAHGNTGTGTFTITVNLIDVTKPVLSGVPGTIAENTEVPTGKVITYSLPTANDNLDGPLAVTCNGSRHELRSRDDTCDMQRDRRSRKQSEATFNVVITLIDVTKPVLSNVPADITNEANGPAGSKVSFTSPTAVDNLDGPIANVGCTPVTGSTFP